MKTITIEVLSRCARCGADHPNVEAQPLDRPHAPPEAAPLIWTHWLPCPVNGQPVMVMLRPEPS